MINIIEEGQRAGYASEIMQLIQDMMDGRVDEIVPVLDLSRESCIAYPKIEELFGGNPEGIVKIMDSLVEERILESKFFDRLIFCPSCASMNLRPSLRCSRCNSGNIARGRILEHFACGKNGLENDFVVGNKCICPHCQKQLKFLGTDYRSLGVSYRCNSCGALSTDVSIRWQCLKCKSFFAEDEAKIHTVHSYFLNEQNRNWLKFEIGYKPKFISYLKYQGYDVHEKVRVIASQGSGASHLLDILAMRDDGFLEHVIGIGVSVGKESEDIGLEDVFRFDNKVYDLGIHDKVLLALPGFNGEARQFARRQRIKTFEIKELIQFVDEIDAKALECTKKAATAVKNFSFENHKQLMKYLLDRGYRIEEKAKIRGRSGAEYSMDILAYIDDGLFTHTVAIGILTGTSEIGLDPVSSFDTKTYDIGIHDKVLLVSPMLSQDAMQFAEQQKIKIIEVTDPALLQ